MDFQGFDAVVGITQDTVNFQLGFLHQHGVIAAAFNSSGAVGSLDVGATGPPTVTLVPASGPANQVLLSLPLQSVGLSYPDGDLGGGAWFDAVTLVFRTSIATAQVTQADVQAMQAQLGGQVDIWSPLADFTDDVFSVRHVFLDLEGLSAADCDLVASGLQDTDASEVQVLVTQTVSHLNANAVQYLVGFGVTETNPSAPTAVLPVFAPTYAQLVTSPYDPSQDSPPGVPDAGLSTLCWLTMLGALSATHSPPDEVAPLSSNVVGAAVRAEQVSGSFVISKQAWYAGYLEGLLWPVLKAMLGPQTAVSPLPAGGWLFQDVAAPEKSTSSGITVTESSSSELTLQPPVNASASTVVLTGTGNLTSETKLREDVVFPQYASVTATASYALSLTLQAGADGTISATPALSLTGAPSYTHHENAMFKALDFFTDTVAKALRDIGQRMDEVLAFDLDSVAVDTGTGFSGLAKTLVLPGQRTFYKDVQVNPAGDLCLHITLQP